MRTKPIVIFWGATAAATLFLGAMWSMADSPTTHPVIDGMLLVVASVGLVASLFVAARIVVVMGRVQRRGRMSPH